MKTIKAPCAARAPTRLGRGVRRECRPRFLEASLNRSCDWVRAAEDAARGPNQLLEHRNRLANIFERGTSLYMEDLGVS